MSADARKLLDGLGSHSSTKEHAVIRALNRLGEDVFPDLIEALHRHRNAHARGVAAAALVRFGGRARPALLLALRDPAMAVRLHALLALDRLWTPSLAPAVIPLLRDPSGGVRVNTVDVLARHEVRRAGGALRTALRDPAWYVRQHAAAALGDLGGRGSRPALRQALSDPRKAVREAAREALAGQT